MTARATFWTACLAALALYSVSPINELGDSQHYALMVETQPARELVEPGHLAWRPLGWLAWSLARLVHPGARALDAMRIVTIAGAAIGVGLAAVWFRRRFDAAVAAAMTALFALGQAWWSYATSACAYDPSVALVLAAFLCAESRPWQAISWMTLAVLAWMPCVVAVPALLLACSLGAGPERIQFDRARFIRLGVAMAVAGLLPYAAAWWFVAPGEPGGLFGWIHSTGHGQLERLSVVSAARALYGWTRLFAQPERLDLDPAGAGWARLFSMKVWFTWGLWKTALAYCLAGAALVSGFFAKPRLPLRFTIVLLAWLVPGAALAFVFKGMDSERWLPVAPALLALLAGWHLGARPGAFRRAALMAACITVVAITALQRFGPNGSLESRPQSKLMREAAPHLRPGDMVYLGGELDQSQLNRTLQTLWAYPWLYHTGTGVVDLWTSVSVGGVQREMKYYPEPLDSHHDYVCESVLGGIPEGAAVEPGATTRRDRVMRRLPAQLDVAFTAGGKNFYELLPDTAGGAAKP